MQEITNVIINGTDFVIDRTLKQNVSDIQNTSFSLGIDPTDGKIYIYVNDEKQGEGIEVSSVSQEYDVIINARGRSTAVPSAAKVDRGGTVSITYDIPNDWILNASATIGGTTVAIPSGNPMIFSNVTGKLIVNVNAVKAYSTLSDLETYFQTPVSDALDYIDGLGSGWAHYIITTDHHIGLLNKLHSADVVSYLLGTGKFDKSILLGDYVDGGYVDDAAYLTGISIGWTGHNDKSLYIRGNHDTYLDLDVVMNDFMSGVSDLVVDTTTHCWYYDNVADGIRFIGLHYSDTNYDFLENAISTLPYGYVYFILNHCPWSSFPAGSSWTTDDTPLQNILSRHTDKILAGLLVGHLHTDSCVQFDWRAWQTMFNCDKMDNEKTEANRETGTAKEHAITLMSVNKTTSTVKFYRIGSVLWRTKQNGSWVFTADTPYQWDYVYERLHFPRSDDTEWSDGLQYLLVWTPGSRLTNNDNGVEESASNWYISDYVYCQGANCIVVNSTAYYNRNHFYDANHEPLNTTPVRTRVGSKYRITVPNGATYWRTSMVSSGYQIYKAIPYREEYTE